MRVILLRFLSIARLVRIDFIRSFVMSLSATVLDSLFHYNGLIQWLLVYLWTFRSLAKHQSFSVFESDCNEMKRRSTRIWHGLCNSFPFNTIYVTHSSICLTMIAFVLEKMRNGKSFNLKWEVKNVSTPRIRSRRKCCTERVFRSR